MSCKYKGCSGLTSISIPKSVTTIGYNTFQDCKNITSINWDCNSSSGSYKLSSTAVNVKEFNIGDNVTIVYPLFFSANTIDKVVLGKSVAYIKSYAFKDSTIKEFYVTGDEPPYCYPGVFFNTSNLSSSILYVPEEDYDYYKTTEPWMYFGEIKTLDGTQPEEKKCAPPQIIYNDGQLSFKSETEGSKFHYSITSRSDSGENNGELIDLKVEIEVSVYASAEGYKDSETVSKTISLPKETVEVEKIVEVHDTVEVEKVVEVEVEKTVEVHDTIKVDNIVEVEVEKLIEVHDTIEVEKVVEVEVEKVVEVHDTVYVETPVDTYKLRVSLGNGGSLTLDVFAEQTYTIDLASSNGWHVNSIMFNGFDVTDQMVGSTYTTPVITMNSTLSVVFEQDEVSGVKGMNASNIRVYANSENITIKGAEEGTPVYIYDTSGAIEATSIIRNNVETIPFTKTGTFILKIGDRVFKIVK